MVKGGYYNKYIKNIFNITKFVAICFQLLPKLFPKLIAWLNTKNDLCTKAKSIIATCVESDELIMEF